MGLDATEPKDGHRRISNKAQVCFMAISLVCRIDLMMTVYRMDSIVDRPSCCRPETAVLPSPMRAMRSLPLLAVHLRFQRLAGVIVFDVPRIEKRIMSLEPSFEVRPALRRGPDPGQLGQRAERGQKRLHRLPFGVDL